MFKNELLRRFEKIFGFEKTTYLAKSESFEQDTLFILIHSSRSRVSGVDGGSETARVYGSAVVFSQGDRFPYGFIAKRVDTAPHSYTKDLFFYDFDQDMQDSPARLQNIHERRTNFVFLYDSQYDPDKGEISSLTLTLEG